MATDPSSVNDPFAQLDEQRTFIKPNPGGRAAVPGQTEPPRGMMRDAPRDAPPVDDATTAASGLNPLVSLANKLLLLVPQLRATRHVDDPATLRNSLAQGIRDFATAAAAAGIGPERVMAARYVLCTMLDEAAADTPWGGSGVWAQHSLLAIFHNETWGGEKVFQLMARLAEKPDANRDLLELIYCALVLGFEGRYRVIDNGRAQLEAVRDKLAGIVRQQRGEYPPALAQHWEGQPATKRVGLSWLPLLVFVSVVALVLVGVYLAMLFSLGSKSDPVFAEIQGLRLTPPMEVVAQAAPKPRLAQFLQSDIKGGLVAVRDEVDRSVVTIRGDGLFAPGSATLVPEREALLGRIGDSLAQLGGNVLVTGHTDSQPIRSARFPSNWHLSEERAKSDPVFAEIQGLRLTPPMEVVAQAAPKPRLAQFLQSDIKGGLVAVRDEVDRSVVTIRGDGLFAPGSATLVPEREALLGRIGDSLAQLGGNVLVTGHTDSQPIRSARFPSNWHLSEERAKSVRELLVGRKVAADRVRAEGRADGEPLAANDTPANRALNRRVEVTLFVPSTTAAPVAAAAASKP